ncbi:MAG: hypothetical protein PHG85_05705, partial [Candidatus Altiarchaeota archaeon]|nr:hypothetical protein [Candidatus Altiarchaeota archaeon]
MTQKHGGGHRRGGREAGGMPDDVVTDSLKQLKLMLKSRGRAEELNGIIDEARQQPEKLDEHVKALRGALDHVPEDKRLEFAGNIWAPMRSVFGRYDLAFSRTLLKVAERGRAMTLGRSFFYGEKGARSIIEGLGRMDEPEMVLDMLLDATSAMTSHKRGIFLSETARPLLERLGSMPKKSQKQVLRELMTIGNNSEVSTAGSIFRLHSLELLDRIGPGSDNPVLSLRKLASGKGGLDEVLFPGLYGKKDEVKGGGLIFDANGLGEEHENRLRAQIFDSYGEVDYIVHPLFALKYVDRRGDHFQPVFRGNTGRGFDEYRQYQKTLEDTLESSDRVTVIACDRDYYQQTRKWLEGLKLKRDVVIVTTRRSTEDDNGTPLKLRDAKDKNPWNELASRMKRLGVVRVNVGGELSFAHLKDGKPIIDNEGSMAMSRHCVAGAQLNLSRHFDVRTLNQVAFPDSPLFSPLEEATQRKRREALPVDADAIVAALPPDIAVDVMKVFGSTPESLRYVRNVVTSSKCDPDLKYAFQSHVTELSRNGSQPITSLFNQAVLLANYHNPEVSDESLGDLCRIGSDLIDLMHDVPYFASHPETNRYVTSIESLPELSYVVSSAKERSERVKTEVGRTGYGGLVRLMPMVMGRLTSPARTDDDAFERQLKLLTGTIKHLDKTGFSEFTTRDVREKTIAALLLYGDECGLLSRYGYMDGINVVLEPGIDLTPLISQSTAEYGAEGKDTMPTRPHMLFIGASPAEFRYSLELIRNMTGTADPLGVLGEKLLEDDATPMNVMDVRMRAAAGMSGGNILKRLMAPGAGRSIGRGLTTSRIRLFDRSAYISAHSTYPLGLDEMLNGPNIDTLIIKGVERWVFAPEKTGFGAVKLDAEQKERLYEYLNAYADKVSPDGCVLVSSDDRYASEFFSRRKDFYPEPMPPILGLVREIYKSLDGAVPIRQYPNKQEMPYEGHDIDDRIGTDRVPGVEYICLIPRGDFTVFRKTSAHTTESAIERANSDIVHSRGTGWYKKQLENKKPEDSFYVWEERLKTNRMERLLGIEYGMLVKSFGGDSGREYPKDVVPTALNDHPQLWQKYRHNKRLLDSAAGIISNELRGRLRVENGLLEKEIEQQALIELEAQGGKVRTYPKTRRQRIFPYQESIEEEAADGGY